MRIPELWTWKILKTGLLKLKGNSMIQLYELDDYDQKLFIDWVYYCKGLLVADLDANSVGELIDQWLQWHEDYSRKHNS